MIDERVKLPKRAVYFLFIYFGVTSILLLTDEKPEENGLYKIMWIIALSGYTALGAYGLISLIEDLRKQGYRYIIRKIRRFFKI